MTGTAQGPEATIPPAPEEAEGPAALRDGEVVQVRRLVEDDRPLVEGFLARLSDTSIAVRFFAPVPRSTAFAELWHAVEDEDRCALVMVARNGGSGTPSIVAHAEYVRDAPRASTAEVAFLVEDAYQGHGCATVLLWRLARAARASGVREFHAAVLMENDQMLEVFRGCGYPIEEWWGPDAVQVTLAISQQAEPKFPRPPNPVSHS